MASQSSEAQKQRLRKLERMSLWSCTFNSHFASARRPDSVGLDRPLSFGETCGALQQIAERRTDPLNYAVPELLRVCLAQTLATDSPIDRDNQAFRHLLGLVRGARSTVDATQKALAEYGHLHFGSHRSSDPDPPEYLADPLPAQVAFPRPTEITYDGNVYTVTKAMLLRCPAASLARFIDPANWVALGPFFELTEPVERHDEGPRGGWHGVLHEIFRIDWNGWTAERFDVHLRVDHTVSDDLVRSDYSLMYDEHDQLYCDDGFAELERIPGYGNWCVYRGTKRLKFASELLNLVAPGVLLMGLEREALGIAALARLAAAGGPGSGSEGAEGRSGRVGLERILQAIEPSNPGPARRSARRRRSSKRAKR